MRTVRLRGGEEVTVKFVVQEGRDQSAELSAIHVSILHSHSRSVSLSLRSLRARCSRGPMALAEQRRSAAASW